MPPFAVGKRLVTSRRLMPAPAEVPTVDAGMALGVAPRNAIAVWIIERLSATGSDRVNPCGHSPALCSLPSLWSFWSHARGDTMAARCHNRHSVGETMVGERRVGR